MNVAVLAVQMSAAHELRPDGQGAAGAFQLEIAVIVEADPDYAQEIWRVADEPAVARCAGLAR